MQEYSLNPGCLDLTIFSFVFATSMNIIKISHFIKKDKIEIALHVTILVKIVPRETQGLSAILVLVQNKETSEMVMNANATHDM